ncbi:tripartite motif-containing protein 42 [Varanus komodoensis]|uniref:tripartite motif-containing protein 42 n=1 Tax=Varanus komodoensis TaxID=61221 RepID=UPI001CF7E1D6|nr:tripartite motif-containing protein 42 [Varanus komodoensis]
MPCQNCLCCLTCPCCPGCNCCACCARFRRLLCNRHSKRCCLCWHFVCSNERNCDCCYCPHNEDSRCQCCHCSCAENPNCRWCCCSCANNRHCKWFCCTDENNDCQCYESRCCNYLTYLPYTSRSRAKRSSITGDPSVISLDKEASGHAFIDQLVCPLCQRLFLRPFMLPCNHCICDGCILRSQLQSEITENFFIITCPICKKAHCLPFTKKIQLRINYLRAKLARAYMRRYGFLRWRFDRSHEPVYCQVCDERRRATKRCVTCQLNYCNICLRNCHQDISFQNHVYAKIDEEIWEERNCMIHSDSLISKYCLDDHELICEYCADAQHTDHDTVSLPIACSKMSAALFTAIAKFKKVRFIIDNDLMEILVLKNNFKSYKETKRREIRNGFIRLRNILQDREKELMEAVENLEIQKQQALYEFAEYTTKKIHEMDSLMQYSKEALKENSQISFLQSANSLITEIEASIASIYQPSPHLREDPIKYLKVNFEELAVNLLNIFPSFSTKLYYEKLNKCPYPCSSDVMIPRIVSSAHVPSSLPMTQSQSLSSFNSLTDQSMINNDLRIRPRSLPGANVRDNGIYAIWHATSSDTERNGKNYETRGIYYNPELLGETSSSVPGLIVIYQTLVYPTVAKIYWTCPTEEVESFQVAYYEVIDEGVPEHLIEPQLVGVLTGIVQQNLEIHNLSPNTEYLFKVRAVNENGPGEWSDICKVVTPEMRGKVKGKWGLLRHVQSAFQRQS